MQDIALVANQRFDPGLLHRQREVGLRDLANMLHLSEGDWSDLTSRATVDTECFVFTEFYACELRFSRLPSSLTLSLVTFAEAPNGQQEDVPLWTVRFQAISDGTFDNARYRMHEFQEFSGGSETPCTDGAAEARGWALLEDAARLMKKGYPFAAIGDVLNGEWERVPDDEGAKPCLPCPG